MSLNMILARSRCVNNIKQKCEEGIGIGENEVGVGVF